MSTTPPAGDRGRVDATHVDGHVGVAETLHTGDAPTPAPAASTVVLAAEGHTATVSATQSSGSLAEAPPTRTRVPRLTALVAGMMVGEYKVETKLGEGGMGAVYGAVHPLIGKRAAIKVLKRELCSNPEAVERFVLEARSVNQIGHPNIVDIFSFGELADGSSYFVMEWLRGESLAQRLRRGRLHFGECLELLDGVIRGLEAAHEKGIIHRDLKPDNVFLVEVRGERPAVKLLDFGIAKLTGGEDNRLERTRTGALIGTPQYIAPEQARGFAIDHRADIYSFGVMAFEMFTGRPPFQADTAMDMISKHLNDTPPRPATIAALPAVLDRIILEMLEKLPGNRPELPRIREVFDEARSASVNVALVGTVPDATLPPAVASRQRRNRLRLAIVGALLVAGSGTGVYFATRGSGSTPAPVVQDEPVAMPKDEPPLPVITPDAAPAVVAPTTGHVVVTFNVLPRTIKVDGVATTPAKELQLDLPPGEHEVVVMAPGYKQTVVTLTVVAGATIRKRADLAKLTRTKGKDKGSDEEDDEGVISPYDKKKKPTTP